MFNTFMALSLACRHDGPKTMAYLAAGQFNWSPPPRDTWSRWKVYPVPKKTG